MRLGYSILAGMLAITAALLFLALPSFPPEFREFASWNVAAMGLAALVAAANAVRGR